jgi:uncharacterized protein (TIGR00255 family)
MAEKKKVPRVGGPHGAVRSMTGYGRAAAALPAGRVVAEVRSVNGRFLKLTVKLPSRYGALEEKVKALLAERRVRRGSVDVGLYWSETAIEESGYVLNEAPLRKYLRQAQSLGKTLKLKQEVPLAAFFNLPGVVARMEADEDLEAVWRHCRPALEGALDHFDGMREKEGAALAADIRRCLSELKTHQSALLTAAPLSKQNAVAKLKERIAKALEEAGAKAQLPAEGLDREVVLLCDRLDVSEELSRLDSHLAQMEAALTDGGEVGKKLDFLTQEVFREINTLGSKAQEQGITHRVIEMKGWVEKIREQVQNLE